MQYEYTVFFKNGEHMEATSNHDLDTLYRRMAGGAWFRLDSLLVRSDSVAFIKARDGSMTF